MSDPSMSRQLKVYQSLWAMQPHDPSGDLLSLEAAAEMVASAGFDGMAIDLGAADVETAKAIRPHLDRLGLTPLIVSFPKSVESLRETLRMARDFGSPYVNVIGQVFSADGRGRDTGHPPLDRHGGRGRRAGAVRDAP